jgi:hypothetical protein
VAWRRVGDHIEQAPGDDGDGVEQEPCEHVDPPAKTRSPVAGLTDITDSWT